MDIKKLQYGNWVVYPKWYKDGTDCYFIVTEVHIERNSVSLSNGRISTVVSFGDIQPVELDENWVLNLGFEKHESLILDSYYINIGNGYNYKALSINIEHGNQYVFLREGELDGNRDDDDVVMVRNGDLNGKLYVHYIQNLYSTITDKELIYKKTI